MVSEVQVRNIKNLALRGIDYKYYSGSPSYEVKQLPIYLQLLDAPKYRFRVDYCECAFPNFYFYSNMIIDDHCEINKRLICQEILKHYRIRERVKKLLVRPYHEHVYGYIELNRLHTVNIGWISQIIPTLQLGHMEWYQEDNIYFSILRKKLL